MILALTLATLLSPQPKTDALAISFKNPPAAARPHTWWHWMDGNVTKEGITADLEAMKEVGIGGAQMFTVSQGIPPGKAGYMSPLWQEMTTHAIKEAGRLGIELCIHNCAGWSSSGGPWITPENAMQVVAWSTLDVTGGQRFRGQLPPIKAPSVYANVNYSRDIAVYAFPKPRDNKKWDQFLGKTGVIREDGIQVDVSDGPGGVAIPTDDFIQLKLDSDGNLDWNVPPGEWTILRVGHVPTGKNNHPAPPEGDGLEVDKLSREAMDQHWNGMMAKVIKNAGPLAGKVLNNALIDSYEVGSQNWTPRMAEEFKRRRGYDMMPWLPVIAGFPVESREKSERFLWDFRKTIADLFADNYFGYFGELCHENGMEFSTEPYGNGGFDSIQVGGLSDIPMGEFWIGGLAMETTKLASSVGHVYGRKVIGAESFTADDVRGRWLEEPYAAKAMGDLVFCNGVNRYIFHRYAMQPWMNFKPGMTMGPWGTHLERTQTWWTEAKTWLKYVARCQNILQSGRFAADTLYYGGESPMTDWIYANTQKLQLPAGYDYDNCDTVIVKQLSVKNGQLVLPSGMTYKVLVLPDSDFMTVPVAEKIKQLVAAGAIVVGPKPKQSPSLVNYPACDTQVKAIANEVWGKVDGTLIKEHAYGKGKVIWGKSMQEVYSGLKLAPDFQYKGISSRAKMAFIHRKIGSAEVYFVSNQLYQPSSVECTFRVNGLQPELWHGDSGEIEDAPVYRAENGRTVVSLNLAPAESVFVVFRRKASGPHLTSFKSQTQIDVKIPTIKILKARYEAADGRGADVTETVARLVKNGELEVAATNSNFGDPVVNVVKRLVVEYEIDGKPYSKTVGENEVIDFVTLPNLPTAKPFNLSAGSGGVKFTGWSSETYIAETSTGKKIKIAGGQGLQTLDLSTGWQVKFPPNWGAPASIELPKLISWTDHAEKGVKYFSGSAVYSKEFDVPASMAGKPMVLDLGRVKNFATVKVNGKELEVLWKEPFTVDVSKAIKKGKNRLEVKITNLWPNRIIGDEQLPADVEWNGVQLKKWPEWLEKGEPRPKTGRYTFTTWRFWTKDSPLLESGLLGPVKLKTSAPVTLRL